MTFYPACGILKTANAKGKNAVISIDRFEEILGELAEELPAEFYTGLNGGILIEDRHPLHPADRNGDLYIMGEYRNDPSTGRCIVLYYGSFRRVFRHLDEDELRTEMRKVLRHEFRHHVEGRAGVRDLEEWTRIRSAPTVHGRTPNKQKSTAAQVHPLQQCSFFQFSSSRRKPFSFSPAITRSSVFSSGARTVCRWMPPVRSHSGRAFECSSLLQKASAS